MKKITKSATLAEILEVKNAEDILAKNGVPCVSCPMAKMEMDELKIGDICKMYNLDEEKILRELNGQK